MIRRAQAVQACSLDAYARRGLWGLGCCSWSGNRPGSRGGGRVAALRRPSLDRDVGLLLAESDVRVIAFCPRRTTVSVRRTRLEPIVAVRNDGVHQTFRWTPCQSPIALLADATVVS
jgi:hypothetical protein